MIDEKKLIDELKQSGMIVDNEYGNVIVDMVGSQPKIGGWIPCSERLPEEYGDYLVTYGFNDVDVKVVDVSSYSENGFEFINVIAWQPLPEPYRPERKSENEK